MSDTVIVIQEECILAASGKAGAQPQISQVERIPLGMAGTASEVWREALRKYMENHDPERVKLVLPTAYSSSRVLQIPFASGKNLDRMAKNVLEENAGDGSSDYAVIRSDKKSGMTLCCAQAAREVAAGVLQIGRDLGMLIDGITVPMECYLRLITRFKEQVGKTLIYLIFEENSVTSLLFQSGRYLYSTRSRIFSERGTLDFGTEIERNISGIMQFYATTRSDVPVTDVYYAGCAADDFEVGGERLRGMNLSVHPIQLSYGFSGFGTAEDYLVCFGALIQERKKTINLCEAIGESGETAATAGGFLREHAIAPIITAAVCLAVFAVLTGSNQVLKSQVNAINDWMNDTANQEEYKEAKALEDESDELAETYRQIAQMKENLETYPDLTEEMKETIIDASGSDMSVQIESVTMDTGVLTFNAVSRQVIDIPSYIQKLENTGLFDSVNYSGYSYDDGEYSLMLSCVLKAEETGGDAS